MLLFEATCGIFKTSSVTFVVFNWSGTGFPDKPADLTRPTTAILPNAWRSEYSINYNFGF